MKDGFIGMGHSQGGMLMRGYLERYGHQEPKMLRLVTLSSPLAGFYCGMKSVCNGMNIPDFLMDIAEDLIYTPFFQEHIAPINYWRDPYAEDEYLNGCKTLPDLDNMRPGEFNQQYKDNYMSVDKHIMFGSVNDEVISPWDSAWFNYWEEGDDSVTIPMEKRQEYIDDTFGLQSMDKAGKLVKIESGLNHVGYLQNITFITEELAPYLVMDDGKS